MSRLGLPASTHLVWASDFLLVASLLLQVLLPPNAQFPRSQLRSRPLSAMMLFRLLLLLLHWAAPLAALDTPDEVCYGNGPCSLWLDIKCGTLNETDPKSYYTCKCQQEYPILFAYAIRVSSTIHNRPAANDKDSSCDKCKYEYGLAKTMDDNWWMTSDCSSYSISMVTAIPTSYQKIISSHTATMTWTKVATFDAASYQSMVSSLSVSRAEHRKTAYITTTYGLEYITPIATAPPSVEDIGAGPSENVAGRMGVDIKWLTGMIFLCNVALILV
jgi:hypothetical protein